jgi:hypothetical protein
MAEPVFSVITTAKKARKTRESSLVLHLDGRRPELLG